MNVLRIAADYHGFQIVIIWAQWLYFAARSCFDLMKKLDGISSIPRYLHVLWPNCCWKQVLILSYY